MDKSFSFALDLIKKSNKIVAFTGAGISVSSGIPDFRSPDGLWSKFDPMEYASILSFKSQPQKFWKMYSELAQLVFSASPNPAHYALVDLEVKFKKLKTVITQNIDILHSKAGNNHVIEIHGSGEFGHCLTCNRSYLYKFIQSELNDGKKIIYCICGGLIKPDIVLFGEPLPEKAMLESYAEIKKADLLLIIGSSLQVIPAADIPYVAKKSNTKIIIINKEVTKIDHIADVILRGRAEDILPQIINYLNLTQI